MTVRQQCCAAIAGLFLVTGAAACGSTNSSNGNGGTTAPQGNSDTASQLATTIENRLSAAGYTPAPPNALIGSSADPPVPEQAFTIAVNPKSPEGYTVTVLVFHSSKDANLFVKHNNAACKAISACRTSQKANYGQRRQQTVGPIIYGAASASGTSVVPTSSFKKIIALAQGKAS